MKAWMFAGAAIAVMGLQSIFGQSQPQYSLATPKNNKTPPAAYSFKAHEGSVRNVFFGRSSDLVFSIDTNGQLKTWHLKAVNAPVLLSTTSVTFPIETAISADGKSLAVYDGAKKKVRFLEICEQGLRELPCCMDHEAKSRNVTWPALCFSHENKILAYSSIKDAALELWHWPSLDAQKVSRLKQGHGCIELIAFSPDSTKIVASAHRSLLLWRDFSKEAEAINLPDMLWAWNLAFSDDGKNITVVFAKTLNYRTVIHSYNLDTSKTNTYIRESVDGEKVQAVKIDPLSPQSVIYCDTGGKVGYWDGPSGKDVFLQKHNQSARALAISSDGSTVACGLFDGTMCVFKMDGVREEIKR